jgi:hypothetical protein
MDAMSSLKKLFRSRPQVVPIYHTNTQVVGRIAWQILLVGRTWYQPEGGGALVSPQLCPVVAALVPPGPEWDTERRYWQNIDNTKLKQPAFPGLFAQGVFNGPFLDAVQGLLKRPQSWKHGKITTEAWNSFVLVGQFHGFSVKAPAVYLSIATLEDVLKVFPASGS